MVLLLNYLPWIIAIIGVVLFYKSLKMPIGSKRNKAMGFSLFGTIAVLVLLQGLTAGYIPKNRSSETKIPAGGFETTEAEIQDNLRAPARLGDESEARIAEKSDWRKHNSDRDIKVEAKPVPATEETPK